MNKKLSIIIIIIVVLAAACVFFFQKKAAGNVLDGPGMVYTWTDYELYQDWIEVNVPEGSEPAKLSVSRGTIVYKCGNTENRFSFTLPEGVDETGKPEGEVRLSLEGCEMFGSLIFHEEAVDDGRLIPVLSGTLFEFDGRGEIVAAEFVPSGTTGIPEDFVSETAKKRNDTEAVPSYFKAE